MQLTSTHRQGHIQPNREPTSLLPISIAIVTRNEEARLPMLLTSLRHSRCTEILVVDNASSDNTRRVAEEFSRRFPQSKVRVIDLPQNHLGIARQNAVTHASSPWIAFIDADCVAPDDWPRRLYEVASAQQPQGVVGVGSGYDLPDDPALFYLASRIAMSSLLGNFGSPQACRFEQMTNVDHLPTCNSLFHRDTLLQAGGFSSQFDFVAEDLELGIRLNKLGQRLLFVPGPLVQHHIGTSYLKWAKKMFRYGSGQIKVMRIHPEFFFTKKSLPLLASLAVITLSFSQPLLALAATAIYVAMMLLISAALCIVKKRPSLILPVCAWYFTTHFCYTLGESVELGKQIVLAIKKCGPNSYRSVVPITAKPFRR